MKKSAISRHRHEADRRWRKTRSSRFHRLPHSFSRWIARHLGTSQVWRAPPIRRNPKSPPRLCSETPWRVLDSRPWLELRDVCADHTSGQESISMSFSPIAPYFSRATTATLIGQIPKLSALAGVTKDTPNPRERFDRPRSANWRATGALKEVCAQRSSQRLFRNSRGGQAACSPRRYQVGQSKRHHPRAQRGRRL